jgi:hypothetical protein
MATTDPGELTNTISSFDEHLRSFHASLPESEQALLEQMIAMAQDATASDVEGFAATNMLGNLGSAFVSKVDWDRSGQSFVSKADFDRSGAQQFNSGKGYG